MPIYIPNTRWNSILTKLNTKRTDAEFSSISYIFSGKVKQSDIDILRNGTIDILTTYGYNNLAEALNNVGYAYSTWKIWDRNWIAEVSLDEIEDILDTLQKQSWTLVPRTLNGSSDSNKPSLAEACASARSNYYKSTGYDTHFGAGETTYWTDPPGDWYYSVGMKRNFYQNINMPVPKLNIGKIIFQGEARRYTGTQEQYSSLDFHAGNYNPATYEDDINLSTEAGILVVSCPLDDTVHTYELNIENTVNSFNSIQLATRVPLCPLEADIPSGAPPPNFFGDGETIRFVGWEFPHYIPGTLTILYHT